ncbi:hypothetical protein PARHAE_01642 [Paracoccus haematequi]|uniref:Uncharacterized protein n=1 Tax=Paracoccus haematequi TaxID=2491866 RepID=A0A447ILP8_9RHOB|nr:hypothetical protein PARHAE_01642 [Paracoccus haematequi]
MDQPGEDWIKLTFLMPEQRARRYAVMAAELPDEVRLIAESASMAAPEAGVPSSNIRRARSARACTIWAWGVSPGARLRLRIR